LPQVDQTKEAVSKRKTIIEKDGQQVCRQSLQNHMTQQQNKGDQALV